MTEFEKDLQDAIEEYRQMRHADGVDRGPDWKGYQVYFATWKGKAPYLGMPYFLMANEKNGEIRLSEDEENLKYLDILN